MKRIEDLHIALVHDWLVGMRGGERCLEVICELFPEADIFSLFYEEENITSAIRRHNPEMSSLGRLPAVKRYYRHLLPLYPYAVRNLSKKLLQRHRRRPYDVVISVSHCAAKNITVPSGVPHISYCLTPMRYLWDQYDAYFARNPLEPLIRQVVRYLRKWDVRHSDRVHHFIGISEYIRQRIFRVYGREAAVIYPPVNIDWVEPRTAVVGEQFLSVNALVPYKNVDKIVLAFNELGLPLTIVGRGPEDKRLKHIAKSNIRFLDYVSDEELASLYRNARALIFAAEEDFGMTPVEVQAAGRPVIAYGKGGVLETVETRGRERTGVFFNELSPDRIVEAVQYFLDHEGDFTLNYCVKKAAQFSPSRFTSEFRSFVEDVAGLESVETGPRMRAIIGS